MSTNAEHLLKEALELPETERARVAAELLASLPPAVPDVERADDASIAELERRARAALSGEPGISWDAARRQIEQRLARR